MANTFSKEELRLLVEDITDKVAGQSDLEWAELCAKHGDRVSPETLRKAGVGLRLAIQAGMLTPREMMLNALSEEADDGRVLTPSAIQDQLDEIYKAKRRLYDQRREYNKTLTADARWEHLINELKKSAEALPSVPRPIVIDRTSARPSADDSEAVLFLSDWHFGLVADNVWNRFNEDVFYERVESLRQRVVNHLLRHEVGTLHVVLMGDMIEGVLRPSSQVESSEYGCSQIMRVSEVLAHLVGDLSAYVPDVKVYSTWGNHGRSVQRFVDSIHGDNMEKIIPWWMRERLSRFKNIEFVDSLHEFIRIDVCGETIAAVHGDLDSKGKVSQVASAVFHKQFGIVPSYVCMGHVHHASHMDDMGTVTITVSSLSGTDSYSNGKRLYASPGQTMLFFTPEDGLQCRYDITFKEK